MIGSRVMKTAPNSEPGMLPSPPMTIIARYWIDRPSWNCSKLTDCPRWPRSAPADARVERAEPKSQQLVAGDADADHRARDVLIAHRYQGPADPRPQHVLGEDHGHHGGGEQDEVVGAVIMEAVPGRGAATEPVPAIAGRLSTDSMMACAASVATAR
jgi:hypothetical protein